MEKKIEPFPYRKRAGGEFHRSPFRKSGQESPGGKGGVETAGPAGKDLGPKSPLGLKEVRGDLLGVGHRGLKKRQKTPLSRNDIDQESRSERERKRYVK